MVSTCDENSIITQSRSAAVVVVTALLDDGASASVLTAMCPSAEHASLRGSGVVARVATR